MRSRARVQNPVIELRSKQLTIVVVNIGLAAG